MSCFPALGMGQHALCSLRLLAAAVALRKLHISQKGEGCLAEHRSHFGSVQGTSWTLRPSQSGGPTLMEGLRWIVGRLV